MAEGSFQRGRGLFERQRLRGVMRPSLLDSMSDRPREWDLESMVATVRRDLECLLNSRVMWQGAPEYFLEVNRSVAHYGLRDFSTEDLSTSDKRQEFCRRVEESIVLFEPRLRRVQVSLDEENEGEEASRSIRIRIEGVLHLDTFDEGVQFKVYVEPLNKGFLLSS